MSRQYHRSSLPPLRDVLVGFSGFSARDNKLGLVIDLLRDVCRQVRSVESVPFYSMREIAGMLKVPLRTIAVAFEKLESEGLLLRLRGSHTKLLGTKHSALSEVSGVVGFPMWTTGFVHFRYRQDFLRRTSDLLWKHYLVPDFVLHWEREDFSNEFIDRILRHRLDYLVWLQPLNLNKNVIETLRDHGIRSVLISNMELRFLPSNFTLDWVSAYARVCKYWRDHCKVKKIAVVEDPLSLTRANWETFIRVAEADGFECIRLKGTSDLSLRLAGPEKLSPETAIAFPAQSAATRFVLRDQKAFISLALRHRILFARDCPIISYVLPRNLTVERLVLPVEQLSTQVAELLLKWRAGDVHFSETIVHAEAHLGEVLADSQAADDALNDSAA